MPRPTAHQLPPHLLERLNQMTVASKTRGETNDCTVVTLALVTDLPYDVVHKELERQGRKHRQGCFQRQWADALSALGFRLIEVPRMEIINLYPESHRRVLRSVTTHHPRRFPQAFDTSARYILGTRAHVAAVLDGHTVDWTFNRAKRVKWIWRVEPIAQVKAAETPKVKDLDVLQLWEAYNGDIVFVADRCGLTLREAMNAIIRASRALDKF